MGNEKRTTLIIGNGLGLALAPEYFKLPVAMKKSWEILDADAQQRIIVLLGHGKQMPQNESDLPTIQEVIFALKTLKQYEQNARLWLHHDADGFLKAYQNYITNIARYFFDYPEELPDGFSNNLCEFIKTQFADNNAPHIVTLNYDKLLYSAFLNKGIIGVDIYKDKLCDGMWSKGFSRENLIRKDPNKFGWYLHLHGSPLYYSTKNDKGEEVVLKDHIPDVGNTKLREHLVLTHSKYKPAVISKSLLLAAYWDYFYLALQESNKVILFGYFGGDEHVNNAVKEWHSENADRQVIIVEWEGSGTDFERKRHWQEKIGTAFNEINLQRMPSILQYPF